MKGWSPYNTLFHSGRYGWFLHNTLSGIMLELDEPHRTLAQQLCDGADTGETEPVDKEFVSVLETNGFLASPEDEKLKLMQLRYLRNAASFGTAYIGLTICPTLACNFSCPYCFEHSQENPAVMEQETMDALLAFIKKHKSAQNLSVSWYGGEPTLAFHVIESLTEKFIELFPDYANASMVTNGYLLDASRIERLNDLRITSIQITIDGSEATHNRRRTLRKGGATYERILHNIDQLMDSDWKGSCAIRVNVDKTNRHEYTAVHKELMDRYKGKKVSVYPGHVNTFEGHSYAEQHGLCTPEWSAFQLEGYHKDGIAPKGGFYPVSGRQNLCIATSHQGYVVGPEGETYKCWEDVGTRELAVGSVHDEAFYTNLDLLARYTIATDPHDDPSCVDCKVFPVCGGGCVKKRMQVQQFGAKGLTYCSPLKESLTEYLDAYLDIWHTNQICNAVLGKASAPSMDKGYRMVQPEKKKEQEETNPLANLAEQV